MRDWANSLLVLALCAVNLSVLPIDGTCDRSNPFVTRSGPNLIRHGERFRFVGVNCYRLAEYSEEREQIFATLSAHGVRVVRFWAFQSRCGPSGMDFSRFDALVDTARRHDMLLLPVLENHWGACTYGPTIKPPRWYESGWREERLGPLSHRDYVRALAGHFRDEPQILAWQLVNEPEIYPDTRENFAVLRRFAVEAARELKKVDPNHLVSLGLLGLGQPSTSGDQFRALHNCGEIDLVSAHDHGYIFEPMPGRGEKKPANSFYADLRDARSLHKPFVATESCVPLSWVDGDKHRRAELFRAKIDAFFAAGGAGYVLWNYEPWPESDCGFDDEDPALPLLNEYSKRLATD